MSSFVEENLKKYLPYLASGQNELHYALCITYTLTVALILVPKCTQLI